MAVTTIEGVIENGQLRLPKDFQLPQQAKFTILINDQDEKEEEVIQLPPPPAVVHFRSPRVVYEKDAVRLQTVLVEG